ncbi:MAG: preprotein translocase subunit YajC [bacterium]
MFAILNVLLMAPGGGAGGTGGAQGGSAGFLPLIILMVGMFAVLYIFSILPQKKRQKAHQAMLNDLKRGDKVITTSGIHGKIASKDDRTVTIEVDDNVKIKMERTSITAKIDSGNSEG